MADYYSILSRALQAPESTNEQWRRGVYERARRALVDQLRAQQPPLPESETAAHRFALDAAITRIELEYSQPESLGVERQAEPAPNDDRAVPAELPIALEEVPIAASIWSNPLSWVIIALIAAAIGAGGYTLWVTKARTPEPQASNSPTKKPDNRAPPPRVSRAARAKDGDLLPGVDGGSTDADLPYYYRRQPVFYRTTNPVGSIVVDKVQRYLYLVQANNTALRYGIGLGAKCADLAGLRKVANKAEWPPWQPPQGMIDNRLAKPGTLAGGPGNPLGARVLDLDDNISRIHGTNAPKTIGSSVEFGCIRLVNDDIADLYNRVPVGTRVIVGQ
jgi:lipoprotein-anchoring transpeptidase ErfK/SrfK